MLHTLQTIALILVSSNFVFAVPQIVPRAVTRFAAFGDSFAAGIGAGQPFTGSGPDSANNAGCGRFDGSFNVKLRDDAKVHAASFDFLACSGATAQDVQNSQLPHLDQSADFITVSMGGNNVGFGDIVNGCVYRFNGIFAPDCDQALNNASTRINNNPDFLDPVTNGLRAITAKAPNAKVYVMGYAKFWNATTTQCDNVSWNYWQTPGATKMTRALRQKMNDLLDAVNNKISTAVQGLNNPRVTFVNYDAYFQNHRFCEGGVNEPQGPNEDRPNMFFFQLNTPVGSVNSFVQPFSPASQYLDWIKAAKTASPNTPVNPIYAGLSTATSASGGLPLWIAKIFHPTSPGHVAISSAISGKIP
ncbi:hypothetical protein GP486_002001 [Trichoglossum hirsutum]|uniref:SGNH hydrolase-type esterase domain-containing protein n=1 Tax=Trichoglossum hirsutum TaxID=265104 RepID=A0A9P8LFT7_9PEZI|nr:hypothetical protein GP486_002001 [Trichoglossum hirsutum]